MQLNTKTENFSISMPSWLVETLDGVCEIHGFSRSGFIANAVKKTLLNMAAEKPKILQIIYEHYKTESS